MNVELEKRGDWWYARIRRPRGQGRSFFQSLGTKNEEEARKKTAEAQLGQIQLAAQADALTRDVWTRLMAGRRVAVRDSITAFREHREVTGHPVAGIVHEQSTLDRFLRFSGGAQFAGQPIAAVENRHVAAFINAPDDRKLSSRTRHLAEINAWLNYCVAQRWLVVSPALEVRVRIAELTQQQLVSVPRAPFTEEEIKKLLACIPRTDFWHGAVLIAYHFGLRIGDIATLEEGNVVAHQLRVFTKKGGRVVNERLPDCLIAWFDEWRTVRPSSEMQFLFPVQASAYLGGDPTLLSKQFRRILDQNGFRSDVSFHGLRKTATHKKWSAELDELGDTDKRALMKLIAEKGYRRVQQLLAHEPGSDVTSSHYLPTPAQL